MKKHLPLLAAAFFLLSAVLAGCGGPDASNSPAELEVTNFQFSRLEGGSRVFTGQVYNPTDRPVAGVQISVSLLDADNRQIASTLVEVRDIAPHDSTAFRKTFDSDEEASGARVRSLTVM